MKALPALMPQASSTAQSASLPTAAFSLSTPRLKASRGPISKPILPVVRPALPKRGRGRHRSSVSAALLLFLSVHEVNEIVECALGHPEPLELAVAEGLPRFVDLAEILVLRRGLVIQIEGGLVAGLHHLSREGAQLGAGGNQPAQRLRVLHVVLRHG